MLPCCHSISFPFSLHDSRIAPRVSVDATAFVPPVVSLSDRTVYSLIMCIFEYGVSLLEKEMEKCIILHIV